MRVRQVVLDTETTGLEPSQGHRVIEIGCVEMVNRRTTGRRFHQYLQPDRRIDPGAVEVHGITNEFLKDKPRFADVVEEFIDFIRDSELIIHNAPFDTGFLDHELALLGDAAQTVAQLCAVTDTLAMARDKHPGQRNSLDALCKRYDVDNSQRDLHGALLDAEILAEVYLAMTGGQAALLLDDAGNGLAGGADRAIRRVSAELGPLPLVRPAADELALHAARLKAIDKASGGRCVWLHMDDEAAEKELEAEPGA